MIRAVVLISVLSVILLTLFAGCSDDDAVVPVVPDSPSVGTGFFGAGGGEFEITLEVAGAGDHVRYGPFIVHGSNIHYDDAAGALVVDLAVTNASTATHPLPVWLTFVSLLPAGVTVLNPDNEVHGPGAAVELEFANEDLAWTPGETSLPRAVQFGTEPGTSIGFGVRIDVGAVPPRGAVAGVAWNDANQDGIRDDGEPGIGGREIIIVSGLHPSPVVFPEIERRTNTAEDGSYRFDNLMPGFYTVLWMLDDCTIETTPHAVHVVLVEEGGEVSDMLGVDFGMVPVDCGGRTNGEF
jgi:hypothetical protein